MYARKAVSQDAAVEVAPELAADEAGEPGATAFVRARKEGLEVLAQDAVEHAPFGLPTLARVARPALP